MRALIGSVKPENFGIAARSLHCIFETVERSPPEVRASYKFYVSMYQIYNEAVFDLLYFDDTGLGAIRGSNEMESEELGSLQASRSSQLTKT